MPSLLLDNIVQELLVSCIPIPINLIVDNLVQEILVQGNAYYPEIPTIPVCFSIKVRPTFKTVIGTNSSDREMRVPQQVFPLWEIEIHYDELRSGVINQQTYTDFMQVMQNFLMMYGKGQVFALLVPWDYSRKDQVIGTGDGNTLIFPIYRTWGSGSAFLNEPVKSIKQVFNVKVNGNIVPFWFYSIVNNQVIFSGIPPVVGAVITITFSFYYLCRYVDNDFEVTEFFNNAWETKPIKLRSVIEN